MVLCEKPRGSLHDWVISALVFTLIGALFGWSLIYHTNWGAVWLEFDISY